MGLQLRADRNDAREAAADLARAHRRGLSGALFRQVAATGNTTLIDQAAHAKPHELRAYTRLFEARQQATRQVGLQAVGPSSAGRSASRTTIYGSSSKA